MIKTPKQLLCAMRWITSSSTIAKITDDITIIQHWTWMTFFVWDQESYYLIHGRWNREWLCSWWFSNELSAIPELKWTLSVVNWKNPWQNKNNYYYWTIWHEWQHNWNSYFMPDKDKWPLTRAKDEIIAYTYEDGKLIMTEVKNYGED